MLAHQFGSGARATPAFLKYVVQQHAARCLCRDARDRAVDNPVTRGGAKALLCPTGLESQLRRRGVEALATPRTSATVLTADACNHREANLAALAALDVPALIADVDMRKR